MIKDLKRILQLRFVPKPVFMFWVINAIILALWKFSYTIVMNRIISGIEKHNVQAVYAVVAGGFIVTFSMLVYRWFTKIYGSLLFQKTYKAILAETLQAFIRKDNNAVEKLGTGRFISILTSGTSAWANTLLDLCIRFAGQIAGVVLAFSFMGSVSGLAFFVGLGVMVVVGLLSVWAANHAAAYRKKADDIWHERSRYTTKIIMSKNEVLMQDSMESEMDRIGQLTDAMIVERKKESRWMYPIQNLPAPTMDLVKYLVAGIYGAAIIAGTSHYSIANLVGLVTSLALLAGVLNQITDYINTYKGNITPIKKLRSTLDEMGDIIGYDTRNVYVPHMGSVTLDAVTYTYTETDVLTNFSCTIAGSKKTALVGVSGSGKSTLIKLIAGYLHPQSGTVLIDDQELPNEHNLNRAVSLKSYYPHIGYLTQEPNVFDGTIRENLLYATTGDVSEQQLHDALEQSQCQFVFDFPNGLDTEIGEKGIRLSGGQRQRLAIAKIMLKNPKIVLLDEPTSALDSISEEAITKALDNLFQGRTVVIVAHRLQTVKKADDIIVLDKGQIIERGTHNQLVAQGGQYAKMLELQSGF